MIFSAKSLSKVILIFFVALQLGACSKNVNQGASSRYNNQSVSANRKKGDFKSKTVSKFKPKTKRDFRREEAMKNDPRFTDHLYFGHKKPPKKRPVGKQKYCKECGIRH